MSLHEKIADRLVAVTERKDQQEGCMKIIVGQMNHRLHHEEHKGDFQDGTEGGIAGSTERVIHAPVAHANHTGNTEDQQHPFCIGIGRSGQSHDMQEGRVKRNQAETDHEGHGGGQVDKLKAAGKSQLVVAASHLFSHQNRRRRGETGKEGDNHPF